MNIAIDTSPLETGHALRGVGSYTKSLIDALRKYESHHSYSLFTRKQKVPDNADLVHYPYFDPFFLTLPIVKSKPTVVTVHDLIPLVFPDKFPAGIRGNIKWQIQRQSLRGAKRILTDSNSSKNDIAGVTGIKKDSIDTVYLAPDPAYHPVTSQSALDGVRNKFSLQKQYILYVGDVNWNKNVMGLLGAFAALRKRKEFSQYKLVLVGRAFQLDSLAETQEINQFINEHGLEHMVIRPGNVSAGDLACLYCAASVYVQPSYYEGFGLPVLEAMACGCPVVCAETSSLKEIAGPSIRVLPKYEDIAGGIVQAVHSERKKLIRQQFEWVRRFTWKRTAQETIQSYEKVLGTL